MADKEVSLETWASGKGIDFKDDESEKGYKKRATRIKKAIELEEPDRVPVQIETYFYPAYYAGMTFEEAMKDPIKMGEALKKFTFDFEPDTNVGSTTLVPNTGVYEALGYNLYKLPGHGAPSEASYQCVEGEYMEADEYDELIQDPTGFWLRTYLPRICGELESLKKLAPLPNIVELPSLPPVMLPFADPEVQSALDSLKEAGEEALEWEKKLGSVVQEVTEAGFPSDIGGLSKAPFDVIGDTLRGTNGVMLDMRRKPEKLKEAMDRLVPLMINMGVSASKASGVPIVFIPLHKGADVFLSDEAYREFYWPSLRKVMEGLMEGGLVPWLFAEGGYNDRLEVLKEDHPDGNAVWHFDQTDMENAKDMIGDQVCIAGNVPSSLVGTKSPEKVEDYCKNLIDKVGPEGFILTNGAVVDKAKAENIQAMIDSVKK